MLVLLTSGAATGGFFLGRGVRNEKPALGSDAKDSGFIITVKLNETLSVGDDLRITLTEVLRDESAKYRITAKVWLTNQPEMQIRKAEEGSTVTYPKEHGYTIKVLKIEPDSAKFSIAKNP